MKCLRLVYDSFGKPVEVLKLEEVTMGDELADGEVAVELVAAPVHPSDMGMISGTYGNLPALPAVGGREGLGRIVDGGISHRNLVGKLVKFPFGSWRSIAVAKASDLFFVPDDVDLHQASMAFINPLTAWMLLTSIRELKPGDWIVQNAANSAVGMAVMQIARAMGIHTINLVRNATSRLEKLRAAGATIVFDDDTFDPKTLADHTGGNLPMLGLNSIGGNSAMNIIKCMAPGGEVVTFGGMVGDKVRFPTRELIFKDLRLRGFWLDKWVNGQSHCKVQAMYAIVFDLIRSGIVHIPVHTTVKLSDGAAAILGAYEAGKDGKVLLVP